MNAMQADPIRYCQSLLDSVTDDGLEELTLRFARPDYPRAYRTGRGADGGIDVLSDLDLPPERCWQSKNGKIDWDDCRDSLRTAMSEPHPPPHYTFVFPKALTRRQLTWWRTKFLPAQRALYSKLQILDFWDDLAQRLAERPDLIDRLNEGALASSYSAVAKAANQTGVNPLASITDLVGDAPELARRAVEAGRLDPRYRYENRQREARAEDRSIPEGRMRFGFDAPLGRPREFTATIRVGDAVQEKAAEPREDVPLGPVTLWFSNMHAGAVHRDRIRGELAAGRALDVRCDADVGLDARPVPDRFATLVDSDGIIRSGEVHIGLSDPLTLQVSMDGQDGPTPKAEIALYRVPSDPGFSVSYGGTFHGALVFLDVDPDAPRPDGEPGRWSDTSIAVAIDADGVPATELVTGMGFVLSFAHSERLLLTCEGLLPADGMQIDITDHGIDDKTADILQHAITVTAVLAQLTRLDGRARSLPPAGSEAELQTAQLIAELLRYGEIRQPLTRPYRYSIPDDEARRDPGELMQGVRRALAPLAGQPTVVAELRIEGTADGKLLDADGEIHLEATPARGGHAEIVMVLVGPVP